MPVIVDCRFSIVDSRLAAAAASFAKVEQNCFFSCCVWLSRRIIGKGDRLLAGKRVSKKQPRRKVLLIDKSPLLLSDFAASCLSGRRFSFCPFALTAILSNLTKFSNLEIAPNDTSRTSNSPNSPTETPLNQNQIIASSG